MDRKSLSIIILILCFGFTLMGCPKKTVVNREPSVKRAEELAVDREKAAKLEAESHGLFVAIDVETEEYEIGDESASAADRLWERLPNAQIYVERVGYPAAFHAYQSSAAHK